MTSCSLLQNSNKRPSRFTRDAIASAKESDAQVPKGLPVHITNSLETVVLRKKKKTIK